MMKNPQFGQPPDGLTAGRRASDTQATRMEVAESDKDAINRWKKEVKAKGKKPTQKMSKYIRGQ